MSTPQEKVHDLIEDIGVGMLTTVDEGGELRSRPMWSARVEKDGDLWFFTRRSSGKVDEISHDRQVNISFSEPKKNEYVSVSGTAEVVDDPAKKQDLWHEAARPWFPEGVDDPDLTLLKIRAHKAEYWDSPSSKMVEAAGWLKAMATGSAIKGGENKKVNLH